MSRRRELIASALRQRFGEVCERVTALPESDSAEIRQFADGVKRQLRARQFGKWEPNSAWLTSNLDCLSALRTVTLDEPLYATPGETPTLEDFAQKLRKAAGDAQLQVELLMARYCVPLNFLIAAEEPVREYVLERLMVQERARIEQHSVAAVSADALLLKLNLISIHASRTTDLRFLDALNYYYELLPSTWQPQSRYKWLLISFLALYARALSWYC